MRRTRIALVDCPGGLSATDNGRARCSVPRLRRQRHGGPSLGGGPGHPSPNTTWLCINFGVVVCIECSGIHRDLGVHISRIQSLTLDNIGTSQLLLARHMTNQGFNDVMEATLHAENKPNPSSTM
ncbi:hypothetical protein LSTR_LSTR016160 [Laodelphax striatellus]|uniref:Arf-GAP domain-containing protein n=1 Tax=Laodelphax striatellus TaxID=195883 RepID=A0A482X9Y4_LAOST|nr:hypothetical protein LSTR_LSTR016160 [Laodelphax striatellus]